MKSSLSAWAGTRRGHALLVCVILLPIAAALHMAALTQIDASRISIVRREQRAQARLLAESAIHVMRAQGGPGKVEGRIEGAGEYKLERASRSDDPEKAVGVAIQQCGTGGVNRTEERITLRRKAKTGPVELLGRESSFTHAATE